MQAPSPSDKPEPWPHWLRVMTVGRRPKNTLIRIAILIAACFVLFHVVFLPIRVQGISMLPTYQDRSVHLINRWAYWHHEPQRGDVVSIRYAGLHYMLMKRVVGFPGETVAFRNGEVVINGKPLDEPYEKWPSDWNLSAVTVASNKVFVVGDNRTMPSEDHVFGQVDRDRIVGKLFL
ncbi:MAG TPA: signal peptidase I [Verrucomicrobiae bacterium]|nr:signal peptidase I [Verrucomicrobiae bacterium]